MNRRKVREHIFKLLFRVEFNELEEVRYQIEKYLNEVDGFDTESINYVNEHLTILIGKLDEIDSIIDNAVENWKVSRMSKVDVTIIRLAVYELKYLENVPTNVAINEAVELAKKYGGENSPSFVNGILGKIVN